MQDGKTNAIGFRALLNTRDNERDPANGVYLSPGVEFGTSRFNYTTPRLNPDFISTLKTPDVTPVISDSRKQDGPFAKYNLDLRRYFTLDKVKQRVTLTEPKHVLATRLLLGKASGNIGFSEQYFIGGADSLRGYADDRYWGNNSLLFSAEYRVPIANHGDIVGVLFTDTGDAWGGTVENRGNIAGYQQHRNFTAPFGCRLRCAN